MPRLARGAPCITATREERPDDRRMHRCTDTHMAPERTHKPAGTPPRATDVGPPRGHTRAHTGAAPGHTHTSHRRARWALCGRPEKVAALARRVYLLICINERLCRTPPASGCPGCRICPRRGTLTEAGPGVPPTLRGAEGSAKLGGPRGRAAARAAPGADGERETSESRRMRDLCRGWGQGWRRDPGVRGLGMPGSGMRDPGQGELGGANGRVEGSRGIGAGGVPRGWSQGPQARSRGFRRPSVEGQSGGDLGRWGDGPHGTAPGGRRGPGAGREEQRREVA